MKRLAGCLLAAALGLLGCSDDRGQSGPTINSSGTTMPLQFSTVTAASGDATQDELDVIYMISVASFGDNEVDLVDVFTSQAVFDTGNRGIWEGREEIEEGLKRWSMIRSIGEMRDFVRAAEKLVFNWKLFDVRGNEEGQGVEVRFDSGLIDELKVTSFTLPYCIGNTHSGCKDYDTGEVIALDPADLPVCAPGVVGPCRDD